MSYTKIPAQTSLPFDRQKKMEKLSNEEKKLDKDLALVTNTLMLFSHRRTYESGNLIFVFHSIVR